MPQEFYDIKKVLETSSTDEVNSFLSQGWKLIDTYKTSAFSTEASDQIVMYILGKDSE